MPLDAERLLRRGRRSVRLEYGSVTAAGILRERCGLRFRPPGDGDAPGGWNAHDEQSDTGEVPAVLRVGGGVCLLSPLLLSYAPLSLLFSHYLRNMLPGGFAVGEMVPRFALAEGCCLLNNMPFPIQAPPCLPTFQLLLWGSYVFCGDVMPSGQTCP